MTRHILIPLVAGCLSAAAQILPDSLTVSDRDLTGDGVVDTVVLTKRSVRSDAYRIWLWDADTGAYTQLVDVPQVRTYRGHIQGNETFQINAAVLPNGSLSMNCYDGRHVNYGTTVSSADLSGPEGSADPGTGNTVVTLTEPRTSPTPQGFLIPREPMRRMIVGVNIVNGLGGGDIEQAITLCERRINDADHFYARDMGLAWEVADVVIRMNGNPSNWKAFWNSPPAGITPAWVASKIKFDTDTGGGSGGSVFDGHTCTCGAPNASYAKSLGHEVAHGLQVGHYSAWGDTMSGSHSALATATVQRMIEHVHSQPEWKAPAIDYGAAVAPMAMEDFANTAPETPVDIDVLANDYDGNGDAVSLSWIPAETEAGGTLADLGNGVVRYTPKPGHLGVDRFEYHITDATGIGNRWGRVKIYVRNPGLAVHLPLDETEGTAVADIGPYHAAASSENGFPSFDECSVPGCIGHAVEQAASGTTRRIQADAGDPIDGDMAVSAWVKFNEAPSGNRALLTKGGAVISGRINNIRGGWSISLVGGKFYFGAKTIGDLKAEDALNGKAELYHDQTLAAGQWYHVAMSMDRGANLLRAWVDGVELPGGDEAILADGVITYHGPMHLFNCSVDDASSPCILDDVRLFNGTLDDAAVATLLAADDDPPAGAPVPRNFSDDVHPLSSLAWTPGRPDTYEFDAYLGTDLAAVTAAGTTSPEYLGRGTDTGRAPALAIATTYYWRVDEVKGDGTVITGPVWRFTTSASSAPRWDDGGSDRHWTTPENWAPDEAPVSGTTYLVEDSTVECPGGSEEGTPKTYTFAGDSLTVRDGTLLLSKKNSSGVDKVTVDIPNLAVVDSTVSVRTSSRNYELTLPRNLHLEGAADIYLNNSAYGVDLFLEGGMTGTGSVRVRRDNKGYARILHLDGGDFSGYSGDWQLEGVSASRDTEMFVTQPGGWGSGDMAVLSFGRLVIDADVQAADSTLALSPEGIVELNGPRTLGIAALEGPGGSLEIDGGAALEILGDLASEFDGAISGDGTLIKDGAGSLTIGGESPHTGSIDVRGEFPGALIVNGSLASASVMVRSDNLLGGSGAIAGDVTIEAAGEIAPGNSIGTLEIGGTLDLSGTTRMEVARNGDTLDHDRITGIAIFHCGGELVVTDTGSDPLRSGDEFELFQADTIDGAFESVELPALPEGLFWNPSTLATDGTLRVTGTPGALDVDHDGDGVPSGIEWVVGSADDNPANPDTAKLPTAARVTADPDGDLSNSEYLLFSYRRSELAHNDAGTSIVTEYGNDLSGWISAEDGVDGVVIDVTDDGFGEGVDRIDVYLPATLAADGRLFVRLRASFP